MIKYHRFGVSLRTDDKRFLIQKTVYGSYKIYDSSIHDYIRFNNPSIGDYIRFGMVHHFGRQKDAKAYLEHNYYAA